MALLGDLRNDVQGIIDKPWNKRTGRLVPSSEDVTLAGGAVELDATMLLAMMLPWGASSRTPVLLGVLGNLPIRIEYLYAPTMVLFAIRQLVGVS